MYQLLKQLLKDQRGMILSSEVVLIGTILVLGSIVGLSAVSHAVTHELNDIANACLAFNGFQYDESQSHGGSGSGGYRIGNSKAVPEVSGH
jgi:Flp pilus assembly pilin Flp